ncbi:TFIIA-alpha and beta-like factor isoform X2 [Brachyhypopomus gauderio]|uniref:TFIIA-alpha and beta-like factor isoform X2 n=1 Tax=Brachyhypopomus gauderio TaxID=698409 RepID=UPI00404182D1
MLSNSNSLPKLYFSIIDDVIESIRELFLDEGVQEGVLDDLRKLWESKVLQSKAVEGFAKDNLNPSNFVLQLPANYSQTLHKPTASVVIPAGQHAQSFTAKASNSGTIATFSLPPGVTYPVQIPAGVTLQTASGHLYKVNVPVMVTQAPGCQRLPPQANQSLMEQRTLPSTVVHNVPARVTGPCPQTLPIPQVSKPVLPPQDQTQKQLAQYHTIPLDQTSQPLLPLTPDSSVLHQPSRSPLESPGEFTLDGIEFSPQPLGTSASSPFSVRPQQQHLGDLQGEVPRMHTLEFGASVQDAVERAVEAAEESGATDSAADAMSLLPDLDRMPDGAIKLEGLLMDYNFNELDDIIQLDGACDSSSEVGDEEREQQRLDEEEEEDQGAVGENEFLGMINAEALKALQTAGESPSSSPPSSDSDEPGLEVLEEEEDPLNSGDDVSEQDIPEVFDTENVIVCQYDKIHRSKNRWKFYLKDGVMCYSGKDYVFSKAVGEAEW